MKAESQQGEIFGKAYDVSLIKRLFRFIVPYRGLFCLALMLLPLQQIFGLAQPIIMKVAIDRYIAGGNLWGLGAKNCLPRCRGKGNFAVGWAKAEGNPGACAGLQLLFSDPR